MIKKLIGIIVAVAVVVIIVVAAIRRDNFQSMVRRDELLNGVEPAAEPPHLISPAELDVPFFVRRGGAVREKRSRRSPPAGFVPVRSI